MSITRRQFLAGATAVAGGVALEAVTGTKSAEASELARTAQASEYLAILSQGLASVEVAPTVERMPADPSSWLKRKIEDGTIRKIINGEISAGEVYPWARVVEVQNSGEYARRTIIPEKDVDVVFWGARTAVTQAGGWVDDFAENGNLVVLKANTFTKPVVVEFTWGTMFRIKDGEFTVDDGGREVRTREGFWSRFQQAVLRELYAGTDKNFPIAQVPSFEDRYQTFMPNVQIGNRR